MLLYFCRESSSVIVSPNSMSHMSENAAAEVAGSSHATASSSKHNLRTSNSSRGILLHLYCYQNSRYKL